MVVALNEVKITQPEAGQLIWVDDEVTLEAIFKPDGVQAPDDVNWSVPVKPSGSSAKPSSAGASPPAPSSIGTSPPPTGQSPPENNYQGSTAKITPDVYGTYNAVALWRCNQYASISFVTYKARITGYDRRIQF